MTSISKYPDDIVIRVLSTCDWTSRVALLSTCKTLAGLKAADSTWKEFCDFLAQDFIHIPTSVADYQKTFFEMWQARKRWAGRRVGPSTFSISVAARFSPLHESSVESNGPSPSGVVPLYQKLQLIQNKFQCSLSEARKLMWSKHQESERNGDDQELQACVLAVRPKQVVMFAPGSGLRPFSLHTVLDQHETQQKVYESTAAGLVGDLLNGQNLSLICYGQTGSGKTFTMFGPNESASTCLRHLSPDAGLVPRVCRELMELITKRSNPTDGTRKVITELHMSYVEVYGNEVADLLHDGRRVGAWHGVAVRSVQNGGVQVPVKSIDELEELLLRGERCKRRAATSMNLRSSRAHSLLFLTLSQRHPLTKAILHSQMCLADLGGSEQVKKSAVTGVRLTEAIQINSALLALKKCILALQTASTTNSNENGDPSAQVHIPYQDSQLTQLLSPALCGQAKTLVVVTASMDQVHAIETLQTLRFAETCRAVVHSTSTSFSDAVVDMNVREMMESLQQEIDECQKDIQAKEQWQIVKREREDIDMATGEMRVEKMTVSVPVGAEAERTRLDLLLARKRMLLAV